MTAMTDKRIDHITEDIRGHYLAPETAAQDSAYFDQWLVAIENRALQSERERIKRWARAEIEAPESSTDRVLGIDRESYNVGIVAVCRELGIELTDE